MLNILLGIASHTMARELLMIFIRRSAIGCTPSVIVLALDQIDQCLRSTLESFRRRNELTLDLPQLCFLLRKVLVPASVIRPNALDLIYDLNHFCILISVTSALSAVAFPWIASEIRSAAEILSS